MYLLQLHFYSLTVTKGHKWGDTAGNQAENCCTEAQSREIIISKFYCKGFKPFLLPSTDVKLPYQDMLLMYLHHHIALLLASFIYLNIVPGISNLKSSPHTSLLSKISTRVRSKNETKKIKSWQFSQTGGGGGVKRFSKKNLTPNFYVAPLSRDVHCSAKGINKGQRAEHAAVIGRGRDRAEVKMILVGQVSIFAPIFS